MNKIYVLCIIFLTLINCSKTTTYFSAQVKSPLLIEIKVNSEINRQSITPLNKTNWIKIKDLFLFKIYPPIPLRSLIV